MKSRHSIQPSPGGRVGWLGALAGWLLAFAGTADAAVIEDIAFTSQPGARLEVQLTFDEPPAADLSSYTIEEPARIVVDLPQTLSALEEKRFALSQPNVTSIMVLESGDRTRLIINLVELVPFESQIAGDRLILRVGRDTRDVAMTAPTTDVLQTDANRVERVVSEITDLTFQRSEDGEGLLVLTLSNPAVDANIFSEGGKITLQFTNTNIRETLIRRFDVTDFATPVQKVEVTTTERGTRLQLLANGRFDYLAYQTGDQYVLAVAPMTSEEKRERLNEFNYVGDRISLNFQNIEVRSVLQLIADFTELNLWHRTLSPATLPSGYKMCPGIRHWIWC